MAAKFRPVVGSWGRGGIDDAKVLRAPSSAVSLVEWHGPNGRHGRGVKLDAPIAQLVFFLGVLFGIVVFVLFHASDICGGLECLLSISLDVSFHREKFFGDR